MTGTPDTPNRQLWLVIWGALTFAPALYVFLAPQMPRVEPQATFQTMQSAFIALAALAFTIGSFVMSRAARAGGWPPAPAGPPGTGDLAAPAAFQTRSVIAMAFFESISVCGFVLVLLGGPPEQVLPWSAASIVGMVAIALPSGLSYWRRWEAASSSPTAPLG